MRKHLPQQLEELFVWLDQHHPQAIDAQLKTDLEAGRIDDRINRALADHKAGSVVEGPAVSPLPTRNLT